MPLTQSQLAQNLKALFEPEGSTITSEVLTDASDAFTNLALHYIETHGGNLRNFVQLEPVRLIEFLKRFYRDAFGVRDHMALLQRLENERQLTKDARKELTRSLATLSIRINSGDPRKTRIAAAFSLWAATFKPVCIKELPKFPNSWPLWRIDATVNFWIASIYLKRYGTVELGDQGNHDDCMIRLNRIYRDFTYRDLTLSSLEFMYAGLFRPKSAQRPK